MKTVSNEKRELLVGAKKRGEKEDDIALWLDISKRSVSRIWKSYKETNSVQPKKRQEENPRRMTQQSKK